MSPLSTHLLIIYTFIYSLPPPSLALPPYHNSHLLKGPRRIRHRAIRPISVRRRRAAALLHLVLAVALGVGLGADGRVQVDGEGEDEEGKQERDGPLEHGGGVFRLGEVEGDEGNGEADLDDDDDELGPEGGAEVALVSVFCKLLENL